MSNYSYFGITFTKRVEDVAPIGWSKIDKSGRILEQLAILPNGSLQYESAEIEGAVSLGIELIDLKDFEGSGPLGECVAYTEIEYEAVRNMFYLNRKKIVGDNRPKLPETN
ncbi:MAG: hypothetical protein ACI861_000464 [Paracoccaceae bacterium]|jgi:hypothetical protein